MKNFKEIYETLTEASFSIVTILLLLNLFTFFVNKEVKSVINTLNKLLPDFIQNYLKNINISPTTLFDLYKLFLLFQLFALLYIFLSDLNNSPFFYIEEISQMFEHSILIAIITILTSNLLSRTNIMKIGISDYLNYISNNLSALNIACSTIYAIDCVFIFLISLSYFHRGQSDEVDM